MVRDNHPRERQARKLARKQGQRAPFERVLIVCEGSKTEPLYFQELRAYHRLNTAQVVVRNTVPNVLPTRDLLHPSQTAPRDLISSDAGENGRSK